MRRLNRTALAKVFQRVHQATKRAELTGMSTKEVLERDRELRIDSAARRNFLKGSTAAAAGLGLAASTPSLVAPNKAHSKIAIIGAGAAGMRAMHLLAKAGIEVDMFEGSHRLGGRMHSSDQHFGGRMVELGGELISTEHTALRNLCMSLGVDLEDVNKIPASMEETYLVDGVRYTEHDLAEEWAGGLYNLFKRDEQLAPWQPTWDVHNADHVRFDHMTSAQYLEQAGYGSAHWVHQLMMTNMVSEYGLKDDCPALNMIYTLAYNNNGSGGLPLAGTDERFHIVGGNNSVIQKMADQLSHNRINTGKKLIAVAGDAQGPYTLSFEDGSSFVYDRLVMALPVWKNRDVDWDPRILAGMSPQRRQAIAEVSPGNNAKVQLGYSDRGVIYQHANIQGNDIHQSAVTYSGPDEYVTTWEANCSHEGPEAIVCNYTGGKRAAELNGGQIFGAASPADTERLVGDFDKVWEGSAEKFTGEAIVSDWPSHPLVGGSFTSPRMGHYTSWWGALFHDEGNLMFAGEGTDTETWGFMEGGIISGERVARYIVQTEK